MIEPTTKPNRQRSRRCSEKNRGSVPLLEALREAAREMGDARVIAWVDALANGDEQEKQTAGATTPAAQSNGGDLNQFRVASAERNRKA